MDHHGRFQVHGYKSVLLDSEPWLEEEPLPAEKAHDCLKSLHARVRESHRRDCSILEQAQAFHKTHDLITRLADNGGYGPHKFTWPKPKRQDQRRVDTEIIRGWAFV